MHKLAAVDEAKSLFNEAKDWGVWRWLTEKKRARSTADRAWAALEEYETGVKEAWSDDLKLAYLEVVAEAALDGKAKSKREYERAKADAEGIDPRIKDAARRLKLEEDEAEKVHWQAEATFDEADRKLSASLARKGSEEAIVAWEMREKVIRKAESLGRKV